MIVLFSLVSGLYIAGIFYAWCYLWTGARPRHSFLVAYAIASLGAILWLPLFVLLGCAYTVSYPRDIRRQIRREQWETWRSRGRRKRQERTVDELEAALKEVPDA